MADFITMTCKSCGGKLQITPEIDDFACMYCGTEFKVNRAGGLISLNPLAEDIKKVSISTDKTASELAIIRLKEDVSKLELDLIEDQKSLDLWKENKEKGIQGEGMSFMGILGGLVISFMISLILVSIVFGIFFNSVESEGLLVIIVITSIICGILIFIFINIRINIMDRNKIKEEKSSYSIELKKRLEKQKHFTNMIDEKNKEIERHVKIVQGEV